MTAEATNSKRDHVKDWIGPAHPDDLAQVTEHRMSQIRDPNFERAERVHDWRNYVGEATKSLWHTFTDEQKAAIALDSDDRAGREEWE